MFSWKLSRNSNIMYTLKTVLLLCWPKRVVAAHFPKPVSIYSTWPKCVSLCSDLLEELLISNHLLVDSLVFVSLNYA